MAQGAAGSPDDENDDNDFGATPDPEVARLVLELDRTIMRRCRAAALRQIVQGQPVPLPVRPSRIELLVLTALVSIYGPLLFRAEFGPVLDQFAECGAVVLLQQVVLANPANPANPANSTAQAGAGAGVDGNEVIKDSQASRENRAAACLRAARPMLEALCRKFRVPSCRKPAAC
ncbi:MULTISPECIES: hypothetical protein [unclassified Caballeronia]|uniref:hypothetical protein n=1 Tax=unclassified Caballeronia TaxID=2646786 RepID=UPI00202874D6|nr:MULTISPECIES: hypothetical protein [unclassified Caballeronia]